MTRRKKDPVPAKAAFSDSAAIYDVLYAHKPYAAEAAFAAAVLKQHGVRPPARLLDLACGTGRHLLEWEELGFAATGADASAAMLEVARHNAARTGSKAQFHHRPFEEVERIPGRFDAVMCMFSALNYLAAPEAMVPFLVKVRARLKRGGLLVLDHWNGFAVLKHSQPVRVVRTSGAGMDLLRTAHVTVHAMEQRVEVRYNYVVMRGGVVEQDFVEEHHLRFHFPLEMRRALRDAGFSVVAEHPFMDATRPPTADDFNIMVVGRAE